MSNVKSDKILTIIIKHVAELGWHDETLNLVNSDIAKTINKADQTVFTTIKEVVVEYLKRNDDLMLKNLEKIDISKLKIRQRIRKAIITRFAQNPKIVINHTAKFLAHPANYDVAVTSLAKTCDKIWYWAGDESTDFNYYTKRILLGAVYTASLAYYLNKEDISIDDLSIFVENRIDNVLQLGNVKKKVTGATDFIRKHFPF